MPADARAGSASRPLTVADRTPEPGDVLRQPDDLPQGDRFTVLSVENGVLRDSWKGGIDGRTYYATATLEQAAPLVYASRADSGPVTICECGDPDCIAGEGAFTP